MYVQKAYSLPSDFNEYRPNLLALVRPFVLVYIAHPPSTLEMSQASHVTRLATLQGTI